MLSTLKQVKKALKIPLRLIVNTPEQEKPTKQQILAEQCQTNIEKLTIASQDAYTKKLKNDRMNAMQGLAISLVFGFSIGMILLVYTKIKGKEQEKRLKKVKEESELIASRLKGHVQSNKRYEAKKDLIEQIILNQAIYHKTTQPSVTEIDIEVAYPNIEATNKEIDKLSYREREELALKIQRALNDFYKGLSAYIEFKELLKWSINADNVFTLEPFELLKEHHLNEYLYNAKIKIKKALIIRNKISYTKCKQLVISFYHT